MTQPVAPSRAFFNPANGSYYLFVPASGLTWQQASAAAAGLMLEGTGRTGHLATLTRQEEIDFIDRVVFADGRPGNVYIASSDAEQEGVWRWVEGPEGQANGGLGQVFWANGTAQNGFDGRWATQHGSQPYPNGDYGVIYSWYEPTLNVWNGSTGSLGSGGPGGYLVEFSVDPPANVMQGTPDRDVLLGTPDRDLILGLDGNDYLSGDAGDDEVDGGGGDDVLADGAGSDLLRGGTGSDVFVLDADNTRDVIEGGDGASDSLLLTSATSGVTVSLTAAGTGTASGGGTGTTEFSGIERIHGSNHADTMTGGTGNDILDGRAGDDVLKGGVGNDTLIGSVGSDTLLGDQSDTYDPSAPLTRFTTIANTSRNYEFIILTRGDGRASWAQGESDGTSGWRYRLNDPDFDDGSVISASTLERTAATVPYNYDFWQLQAIIRSEFGDSARMAYWSDIDWANYIVGYSNLIEFIDLKERDYIHIPNYTEDADVIDNRFINEGPFIYFWPHVLPGAAFIAEHDGINVDGWKYYGDFSGKQIAIGRSFYDRDILATIRIGEIHTYSEYDDRLEGGAGNDHLNGQKGDDLLIGGAGNDQLHGGDGNDTASFENSDSGVTIRLSDDAILGGTSVGEGTDSLYSIEHLISSRFADDIFLNQKANRINAGDGDDVISGASQNDQIFGGAGNDTIFLNQEEINNIEIDGGGGFDIVKFDGLYRNFGPHDRVSITDIEHIIATEGSDSIDLSSTWIGPTSNGSKAQLSAGAGSDWIVGGEWDILIEGGTGNDTIIGGFTEGEDLVDGIDGSGGTVVYSGSKSDYEIVGFRVGYNEENHQYISLRDKRDTPYNEGTDTLYGVDYFKFADATVSYDAIVPTIHGFEISVHENAQIGDIIGRIYAKDSLSGAEYGLTFTLDPYDIWNKVETDSFGNIFLHRRLDFEEQSFINGSADFYTSSDASHGIYGSYYSEAGIQITVLDANDAPTALTASNAAALAENTSVATRVADLTVVDEDRSAAFRNYVFTVSDARFEVRAAGEGHALFLKAGQSVDFEQAASIAVTVTADDGAGRVSTIVNVTVTDVNENGGAVPLPPSLELSAMLAGTGPVSAARLNGAAAGDQAGLAVAGLGDVNGDGVADLIVGAPGSDPSGRADGGRAYLVYGGTGLKGTLELSSLNGTTGTTLQGGLAGHRVGVSVASAGDLNGDGLADLIIGSVTADPSGRTDAGESYVVFGRAGLGASFDLAGLNGSNGFRLTGAGAGDRAGTAIAGIGDFNKDGFDDLAIGAPFADPLARSNAGATYIVYGKAGGFGASLDLAGLTASAGLVIQGDRTGKSGIGASASAAGDLNGDGFDDVIIGGNQVSPGGRAEGGEAYVVFGRASGAATLDVRNLNGTNGFRLMGQDEYDQAGISVAAAGDVNGDGRADLIVGAHRADPDGKSAAGETYLVFGQASWTATNNLGNISGTRGVLIKGIDAEDRSGFSVTGAGDVNGDGFADLLIGAWQGDPGGRLNAGESYLVFGKAQMGSVIELSALDGKNGVALNGRLAGDSFGYSVSAAGDVDGDGYADLLIGAPDADPNGRSKAGEAYILSGKGFATGATPPAPPPPPPPSGDLLLIGTTGDDTLTGFGGNDELRGLAGNDTLIGGPGNDRLDGGEGSDTASFAGATGSVTATLGADDATPGSATGEGTDTLISIENVIGSRFADVITGNEGANRIEGGDGDDLLIGNDGGDTILGGRGNDRIEVKGFVGQIDGGEGFDTLQLSENWDADQWGRISNIEAIVGTAGNDHYSNTLSRGMSISGGDGDDYIEGGGNGARITGGRGNDVLIGGGWRGEHPFDYSIDMGNATVVFSGRRADYEVVSFRIGVREEDRQCIVLKDKRVGEANEGIDLIHVASHFEFSDQTVTYADILPSIVNDTFIAREDLEIGSVVGRIAYKDKFNGNIFNFKHSANEFWESHFTVDENANIIVKKNLDFETIQKNIITDDFYLDINFSSIPFRRNHGVVIDQQFTINIQDVNEAPTALTVSNQVALPENTGVATRIADLVVTDEDRSAAFRNYVFTVSDARFEVKAVSGGHALFLKAGQVVDFEASASIPLTIGVSDGAGSVSTSLTIAVTDVVEGGGGSTGTPGDDRGANAVRGTPNADTLFGLGGHDELFGFAGNDTLDGGDGDDELNGGAGADVLIGGNGRDTATYATATAAVKANLSKPETNTGEAAGDTYSGVENLTGSAFNDTLSGTNSNNVIRGGAGGDLIYGAAGNDTIHGGDGADNISGQGDNDVIYGEGGSDRIGGGRGRDTLHGGLGEADTFVFEADWDQDTIMDFENGSDMLDFRGSGLTLSKLTITASGADTLISKIGDTDTILIKNVAVSGITAADFWFV